MDDDVLPYDIEHIKIENEQTEFSIIEQNTPHEMRTRAKTKTAPESLKKEKNDRSSFVTPAKNNHIKCKTTQQNADLDGTSSVDQSEPIETERPHDECLIIK